MFKPGSVWNDTAGKPIQAHGAGFLYHDGRYYWFGQNMDAPTITTSFLNRCDVVGISCYSSDDLYHWRDEGLVLPTVPGDPQHDLHPSKVVERPKVIFNKKTGYFVMWLHIDYSDYTLARTGVAVSNKVTGPYTFVGSFQPCGRDSRDMTIFQEDDGKAYLIFSTNWNNDTAIAQLTDDYLHVMPDCTLTLRNHKREAYAVFKHNGTYYLITSGCTGWEPNEARYAVAHSMLGPWQPYGSPCDGPLAETTFAAQGTFILPVADTPGAYIFVADRWNSADLKESRYVWLPLLIEDGHPVIRWYDEWDLRLLQMSQASTP